MKKILNALYTVLCHFSLAFSGIVIFFWGVMNLLPIETTKFIDYEKISVFLMFSAVFGLSSLILRIPRFPKIIEFIFHFVINIVAFVFAFTSSTGMTQNRIFIAGFLFAAIYLVVFFITRFFLWLEKKCEKKTNEEKAE